MVAEVTSERALYPKMLLWVEAKAGPLSSRAVRRPALSLV
mgnify:CR=1 FL=1